MKILDVFFNNAFVKVLNDNFAETKTEDVKLKQYTNELDAATNARLTTHVSSYDHDASKVTFNPSGTSMFSDKVSDAIKEAWTRLNDIIKAQALDPNKDPEIAASYDGTGSLPDRLARDKQITAELSETLESMKLKNALYSDPIRPQAYPHYVNNDYAGQLRTFLRGRQIYNVADNGTAYGNWSGASVTFGEYGFEITANGTAEYAHLSGVFTKENQIYSVVIAIDESDSDGNLVIAGSPGLYATSISKLVGSSLGVYTTVFTSESGFTSDGLRLGIQGGSNGQKIKGRVFVVSEKTYHLRS